MADINDHCNKILALSSKIISDKEVINYFADLKKDSLTFYLDTTLNLGFNYFIINDLTSICANLNKENENDAYSRLSKEQAMNLKFPKSIILDCIHNNISVSQAELEVKYWYHTTSNLYSIEISKILKTPGYNKGYIFLIGWENGDFKVYKRSNWIE
jgi:hypothetical protein